MNGVRHPRKWITVVKEMQPFWNDDLAGVTLPGRELTWLIY